MLVCSLKASLVFAADLSRAIPILHAIDFVELANVLQGLIKSSNCARTLASCVWYWLEIGE